MTSINALMELNSKNNKNNIIQTLLSINFLLFSGLYHKQNELQRLQSQMTQQNGYYKLIHSNKS